MNQVERDLHEALRRRDAPPFFAERVLARTRQQKQPRRSWAWLTAVALVVLMIGGIGFMWEQRRQAEGERAKEQLMIAFKITGTKLRDARERLAAIHQRAVQRSEKE